MSVEFSPFDNEGRLIALEFNNFVLINIYVPNAGENLKRMDYRIKWDKKFRSYLKHINKKLLITGDFNVAFDKHLDIWNPNYDDKPGTTIEERSNFKKLLDIGLVDTYRKLYKTNKDYTYWSYRGGSFNNNRGWRLDYFVISKTLLNKVKKSKVIKMLKYPSDHAPILLDISK